VEFDAVEAGILFALFRGGPEDPSLDFVIRPIAFAGMKENEKDRISGCRVAM
jgi:hypothetical protein